MAVSSGDACCGDTKSTNRFVFRIVMVPAANAGDINMVWVRTVRHGRMCVNTIKRWFQCLESLCLRDLYNNA
jgi:hypothetical protein